MTTTGPHDLSKLRIERKARPAARWALRRRLGPAVFLTVLAGLGYAGWRDWRAYSPAALPVESAVVSRVRPGAAFEDTSASGYVAARTRASVASPVQGRLIKLHVDTGQKVEKDQILAEIQHDQ